MKNKMTHVRDHLIAQLETLGDPDVKGEKLKEAMARAASMNEIAKTLVDSAKAEAMFIKAVQSSEKHIVGTGFIALPSGNSNS